MIGGRESLLFHRKPGGPRSGKYNRKLNLEIRGLEKAESRPRLVTKLPGKLGIWQTARSLSASAEGVVDGARQCQDTRRGEEDWTVEMTSVAPGRSTA